jgi:hypothetical protein
MDQIVAELLKEGGKAAVTAAIGGCIARMLAAKRKKRLTPEEKAEAEKTAQKMIYAVSNDDIWRFSPTYHRISGRAKKSAARKAVRKRTASVPVKTTKPARKKATKN